ncbi:MAG TPA: PHB depolymerase family esterase [Pyrinomonadaceae bacterium]|jgi:poly(3-hydroxybutyrate) depolymerase|nr:PHB depolymerase family esterase [Pyrinomonadaceae bacterium]
MRLLTFILLLAACSSVFAKDDVTKELITSSGKTRAYYLYLPSTVKTPAPLIVMLHGSNRTGVTLVEKWKDFARKEGIILAGPDATNLRGWAAPQDGPDFLRDLVEELKSKYPVNPRRVYLFGHSAGASFALQISLMESQYFAATAVHAGALPEDAAQLIALAKRKIPMSIQVGDSDEFFPLKIVRETRDVLKNAGIPVELVEIKNHDHWYYDQASKFNQTAWEFLKKYELDAEPFYQKYKWDQ